jgi:hypothetical protein
MRLSLGSQLVARRQDVPEVVHDTCRFVSARKYIVITGVEKDINGVLGEWLHL